MTDDETLAALRARIATGHPTDVGSGTPPSPASPAALARAEEVLGFPLPPLLRRIYGEVANGGVGPFRGIEGVDGGHFAHTPMLKLYQDYLAAELEPDDPPAPPPGVVFFCDFGDAMSTLLDCRRPGGQMWWWEEGDRYKLDLSFEEWFGRWLNGDLPTVPRLPELALDEESWTRAAEG